jgi:hypothetical protein
LAPASSHYSKKKLIFFLSFQIKCGICVSRSIKGYIISVIQGTRKNLSVKGHNSRLLQVQVDECIAEKKRELHSHTSMTITHSSHTRGKESCPTNENQPTASLQTTYRCTIPTFDIEPYRQTTKESPVMVGHMSQPVQTSC